MNDLQRVLVVDLLDYFRELYCQEKKYIPEYENLINEIISEFSLTPNDLPWIDTSIDWNT